MLQLNFFKISIFLTIFCLISCTQATDSIENQNINNKEICENPIDFNVFNGFEVNRLLSCNRSNEAFKYLTKHRGELNFDQVYGVGALLFEYDYFSEAIPYLKSASFHNDERAVYLLGVIYTFSRDYKNINKAIESFTKSAELGSCYAYYSLGDIYLLEESHKDIKKAEMYFNKSLECNNFLSYYGLGEVALEKNEYEKAFEYFSLSYEKGYEFEANAGFISLYLFHPNFKGYDPDKAKKYLDLILKERDNQKNIIASDFYAEKGKYYNKDLSDYYMKLAERNEPHKRYR